MFGGNSGNGSTSGGNSSMTNSKNREEKLVPTIGSLKFSRSFPCSSSQFKLLRSPYWIANFRDDHRITIMRPLHLFLRQGMLQGLLKYTTFFTPTFGLIRRKDRVMLPQQQQQQQQAVTQPSSKTVLKFKFLSGV